MQYLCKRRGWWRPRSHERGSHAGPRKCPSGLRERESDRSRPRPVMPPAAQEGAQA